MIRVTLCVGLALTLAGAAAGEELFFPMVAQRQGAEGGWWNTEVWICNTTSATGGYAVVFLPGGQNNLDALRAEPPMDDVAPGVSVFRSDLVPQGGAGVLRVLTTPGIVVYTRVFNAAGRGSFGQGMSPLTRVQATKPGEIAHLVGLRRTPQFRTNVAFFNPTGDNGTVQVRVITQNGEVVGEDSYRLAPGGYLQVHDFLHAFGVTRGEHLRVEVSGTVPLFALASVIDARSGAPTIVTALH